MSPPGEDLSRFRGVLTFEHDLEAVHVRASAEKVTEAVAALREGTVVHSDVVGKEIPLTTQGFLVIQFQGHDWSSVVCADLKHPLALRPEDAQELSRRLRTRCINLRINEDDGVVAYSLVDKGEFLEGYLCRQPGIDDEFADAKEFEAALRADLGLSVGEMDAWRAEHWEGATAEEYFEENRAGAWFVSERRKLGEEAFIDPYSLTDTLLREEGAANLGTRFDRLIRRETWAPGMTAVIEPTEGPAYRRVDWISMPESLPCEEGPRHEEE